MNTLLIITFVLTSAAIGTSTGRMEPPGCYLKHRSWVYNADVSCLRLPLVEGSVLKLEDQSAPLENVTSMELIYVTGTIDSTTFSMFPNLKTLIIKYSKINKFSPELSKLEAFAVQKSKFPTMSNYDSCCKNLKILKYTANQGLQIEPQGAFEALVNLETLHINRQTITRLSKEFFKGLGNLKVLQLSRSQTEKVDEDAFTDLPKLEELHFKDDSLSLLEPDTLKPLKQLKDLKIFGRKLRRLNLSMLDRQRGLEELGLPGKSWKSVNVDKLLEMFPNLTSFSYQMDWKPEDERTMREIFSKLEQSLPSY